MTRSVEGIDVIQTATRRQETPLEPGSILLAKGHRLAEGRRPFDADTIFERDVAIPMRDGLTLRADIFRPAKTGGGEPEEKVPVLIAWGPYGKESGHGPTGDFYDALPGRMGLPKSKLSGYQSFEAPDPVEWTAHGYALCNVDIRGIGNSEGHLNYWGTADGRDGYDAVEYLAQLPWCNGSAALVGNSWLAISQWFIAAEQPPHLKCIAPLEGSSDTYRENLARGGVPTPAFTNFISSNLIGREQQEDMRAMLEKYPTWNEYWEDKRARMDRITVPSYILASFSTGLHTAGSFRAYEEIKTPRWLRVHDTQEWFDLYSEHRITELRSFFDRYTKGIQNNWEATPRVRLSVLGFNKPSIVERVVPEWPLPSTEFRTLYLHSSSTLQPEKPVAEAHATYQSDVKAMQVDDDPEELRFQYTFTEDAILAGYSSATLFMSCKEHDDLDVFVQLRKADANGMILQSLNIPAEALGLAPQDIEPVNPVIYLGPTGVLRASHRKKDKKLSKPYHPISSHTDLEPVPPGTIVKLEIGLWPTAISFDKGEKLILKVSGHPMTLAEFVPLRGSFVTANKGQHTIYLGGEHSSFISIPIAKL
ncbi:hypothetical protein LCI18_002422 [Fusarium solani-melongenae]|uniref:Uncharacterized protein n=1 Tax=Fusarium solani subsp. cucurbitae TaxID=2747967 RepID=A0ACD3YR43_FUSSC|nr:hypothetical protein LCI18_002422 [Fusarium solani-melongenae]